MQEQYSRPRTVLLRSQVHRSERGNVQTLPAQVTHANCVDPVGLSTAPSHAPVGSCPDGHARQSAELSAPTPLVMGRRDVHWLQVFAPAPALVADS